LKIRKKVNNEQTNNLEEEEEEVLNVLYSLAKEKQKSEVDPKDEIVNNNDNLSNNNNNESYPNELYKLSLIAILNPINDEEDSKVKDNNNNEGDQNIEKDKSKELKMRNILRRSMENFDNTHNNNIKKRKFDYEFQTNLEFSSDANTGHQFHHFSPNKLIKL